MASVRELLQHFKDDAKLQPLFIQMEELEKRVEAANAQNVSDARSRSRAGPGTGQRPGRPGSRASRMGAEQQGAVDDAQSGGATSSKIEEAVLPLPPSDPYGVLPTPQGGYDWEALQQPVNQACAQFTSPAAKATWKKWALTSSNVGVVVGVAWWVVAHVFRPDHPLSAALKEHVFRLFSKQYALDVLAYGGAGKELYHNLWHSVMSSAAVELLKGAFPRSTHKLDKHLVAFVQDQLIRWTTGPLPADLHPSHHELVNKSPPAAQTHVARHHHAASLSDTAPSPHTTSHHHHHHHHDSKHKAAHQQHSSGSHAADGDTQLHSGGRSSNTSVSPFFNAYSGSSLSLTVGNGLDGPKTHVANVVSGAALSPSVMRITDATAALVPPDTKPDQVATTTTLHHTSAASPHTTLKPTRSIIKQLSLASHSVGHHGTQQHSSSDHPSYDQASSLGSPGVLDPTSPDAAVLLSADGPGSKSRRVMMSSPFADNRQQIGSLLEDGYDLPSVDSTHHEDAATTRPRGSPPTALQLPLPDMQHKQAVDGDGSGVVDGAPTAPQLPPTGFQLLQHSPTVSHLFEVHSLGMPRQAEGAFPGLMSQSFGVGQRSRRRPLDAHAPVPKPALDSSAGGQQQVGQAMVVGQEEPEFSYKALAKQSCQRAADAVARYEACKAATRKDVARLRKEWLSNRNGLQSKVSELASACNAAKDMSDKLSHWIENDVDRMLRDQPAATTHIALAKGSDLTPRQPPKALQASERGRKRGSRSAPATATEAVLAVGGGASVGASLLAGGGAPSAVDRSGRPPNYLSMTEAAMAGAGRASASFLALTASTASNSGPSMTRIMQPWARLRSVETHIRSTLSQSRYGSNDIASKLAVQDKARKEQEKVPGMMGNGQRGAAWRPAPVEYARGALDFRLKQQVQQAMVGIDLELYKS